MLLNILLFVVSLLGYYLAYRFFCDADEVFFPVVYISVMTVVTYLFGLLGFLKIGVLVAESTGLALLLLLLYKKRRKLSLKSVLAGFINPTSFLMLIGIVWAYVITRNVGLSHSDDYNHWYRICKAMSADNLYPWAADITFITYPPGTATWIYFFTRTFGFSVPNCFWAQTILNLSGCCTLFHAVSKVGGFKEKTVKMVMIAVASAFLCSLNLSTYTLVVDACLGIIAMAAAIYMLNADFTRRRSVVTVVVLLTFLNLIKISGVLFEIFVLFLYLLLRGRRSKITAKGILTGFVITVIPTVFAILYRIRNSHIYTNIDSSEQAISSERFLNILASRSNEEILLYTKTFIKALDPFRTLPQITVVYYCLLAVIILAFFKKDARNTLKKTFLYLVCTGVVYFAMLYLTYLLSMELWETLSLNSFYRYAGTLSIYFAGLTIYSFILRFNASGSRFYLKALAFSLLLVVIGQAFFGYGFLFGERQELYPELGFVTDTPWKALEACSEEVFEYNDESYYVIWDEQNLPGLLDRKITYVITSTYFRSCNVECEICDDIENAAGLGESVQELYDHVVIVGKTSRNDEKKLLYSIML